MDTRIASPITPQLFEQAYTYPEYLELIHQLVQEGKTTGPKQTPSLAEYTRLNSHRMKRLGKTVKLTPELVSAVETLPANLKWLVITEGWCGDAAQIVPLIDALAQLRPDIELKLILRDEHLEVMDAYLTEGSRSIPKWIILDENWETLTSWGPRPAPLQQRLKEYKQQPDKPYAEFAQELQLWYNKDKTQTIQGEMVELLKKIK